MADFSSRQSPKKDIGGKYCEVTKAQSTVFPRDKLWLWLFNIIATVSSGSAIH